MEAVETKRFSFPVKVILQEFFTDHRQKAYICVKGHWRTIRDLQNHIVNLFSLSHEVFLTDTEGFLYPAQESIDIIQQGNSVILVNRENQSTEEPQTLPENGKVSKTFKPPRNSTPFLNGQPAAVEEFEVTETPIVGVPPPKENGAVLPEVREKQKRRKRVRKRKKNNTDVLEDSSSILEEPADNLKRLKGSKSATHIRFGGSVEGDDESGAVDDNLQITDTPHGQSQMIVSRTLHRTTQQSPEAEKSTAKLTKSLNKSNMSSKLRERLPNLDVPLLKKLPKKDDVIAFKVLKMGETYEPVLSNYIIGIVEMVNREKNEVSLLLLSGEDELKPPQGKFSLPDTPSAQSEDNDEILDDDLFVENFSKLQDVRKLDLAKLGTTF
uniref:Uncharacterized protein n=1 Tax=Lutzomyia longipalpis TaxID=7200 RepID=A0A1B0CMD2_LUTLO